MRSLYIFVVDAVVEVMRQGVCVCVWFAVKSGVAWYHTARWGVAWCCQTQTNSAGLEMTFGHFMMGNMLRLSPKTTQNCQKGRRIIGVGCAALKTARIHNKMCKVAYVFDLNLGQCKDEVRKYTVYTYDLWLYYACYMYLHVLHILIWCMLYPNYIYICNIM